MAQININRSINQLINQPINQSRSQSANQIKSMAQTINQWNVSIRQPMKQSVNHSIFTHQSKIHQPKSTCTVSHMIETNHYDRLKWQACRCCSAFFCVVELIFLYFVAGLPLLAHSPAGSFPGAVGPQRRYSRRRYVWARGAASSTFRQGLHRLKVYFAILLLFTWL